MVEAVASSTADKYLIGIRQSHFKLIGLKDNYINELINDLIEELKENIENKYLAN